MSLVSVDETWTGRSASDDIHKRALLKRTFDVWTDDPDDDQTVALDTPLLPRLGEEHPNYPDAYVVSVGCDQDSETPELWRVFIQYDTELPSTATESGGSAVGPGPESQGLDSTGEPTTSPTPMERPANPIDRPAVISRHTVEVEEPFVVDAAGNPVLNSAGLPYDPPPMTHRRELVVIITKNVAGVGNATIDTYIDTVNDDSWKGIAAGKARIMDFRADSNLENGIPFTQVQLTIQVRKRGWNREIIDRGFYELVEDLGSYEWVRNRDTKTGLFPTEPMLLDGEGLKLAAGEDAVIYPDGGYQEFAESDFDALMTLLGIS